MEGKERMKRKGKRREEKRREEKRREEKRREIRPGFQVSKPTPMTYFLPYFLRANH